MGGVERSLDPEELLQNSGWMRGLARSLVTDDSRADDVVQQTWLAFVKSPPRHAQAAVSWLGTVVRNLSHRTHREESRRNTRERAVARPEATTAPPDEVLERAELQRSVVDEVLALSEPYRTTVLLRYFEDLSPPEIALRQGIPEKTVWTRLRRAMEQLRGKLDRHYDGNRETWCALLLPLIGGVVPSAAATSTSAGASSGAQSAASHVAGSHAAANQAVSGAVAGAGQSSVAAVWAVGGSVVAQKTLLVLGVGTLALAVGWGVGRTTKPAEPFVPGGSPARVSVAPAHSSLDKLEAELADARQELQASVAERDNLRARVDELETKLAVASTKVPASPATSPLAIAFGEFAETEPFEEADWDEMAAAVQAINELLVDLVEGAADGEPAPPDLSQRIQTENMKLVAFATTVIGKIPTHSPINGEFSHPLATANLMSAILDRAEQPLSERQRAEIAETGSEFQEEYDRLQGTYGDETLLLKKLLDEVSLKRDIVDSMGETLSPEQQAQIAHPKIHHRLQLDTMSPFVMIMMSTETPIVFSREHAVEQLREELTKKLQLTPAQADLAAGSFETWGDDIQSLLTPIPQIDLRYLHLDDALTAGWAYLRLLESLSESVALNEVAVASIKANMQWPVPRVIAK